MSFCSPGGEQIWKDDDMMTGRLGRLGTFATLRVLYIFGITTTTPYHTIGVDRSDS